MESSERQFEAVAHTPSPRRWHWGLLVLLMLLFGVYYGWLALRGQNALVSSKDLANVDQAVWTTVHGQPFRMTTIVNTSNRLGVHVDPILLAVTPLYALFPSPKTLIVVQVIALALVAVPLYVLTTAVLGNATRALAIPLLYLLSPATHSAALDFHPVGLGVLPAMASLLAVWRGQTRAALLLCAIALLAREDYGLWLAALSFIGWWRTRERVWGIAALVGLGWFLVAITIIPSFFVLEQRSRFLERYQFWLEGPVAWQAQGFLAEKGQYLRQLLMMGGAGALLSPLWILPALPALVLNLLSNFVQQVSLDTYYSVLVAPTLLAASAIGLRRLRPRWQTLALLLLLASASWVHLEVGRSPLVPGFHPPERTTHSESLPAMLADLPAAARLSTSAFLAPHASGRETLRIYPNLEDCDFVLLDLLQDRSMHPMEMRRRVVKLLNSGWSVRSGEHGFLLLEKGQPPTEVPTSFYTFARPEHAPQYPTTLVFGGRWELEGYDVFQDYWGRPAVRLYWQALQPPDGDWQPAAIATAEDGRVLATPDTHTPVVLLWFSTSRWTPGETYVVEMLPFDAPGRVTLAAGVGAPLIEPDTRLTARDGRDLVPLATLERRQREWQVTPTGQQGASE